MFLYQSSQPTSIRRRSQGNTNAARTEQVFEQIATSALPANPKALARLNALILELENGRESARRDIAHEIISDPGLGLYYLSNIRSTLNLNNLPEDPLLPIHEMQGSQLKDFFNLTPLQISKFRFSDAGPPQILRLQHTFIASQCAANLSRQLSIEEGKAFSLVNVSQSALNLLSWSYPNQFHKALFNKRRYRSSLEESLSSLVGVKPENIINKLAKKIGLPTSLLLDLQLSQRSGVFDFSKLPDEPSALNIARIGDLLAKANDSEHYPEALALWEKVERQLEDRGIENPKEELYESIKSFMADIGSPAGLPYHSTLFPVSTIITADLNSNFQRATEVNSYLKKIPDRLRPVFEKIYNKLEITRNTVSVASLEILIAELIPLIGVYSGCLYLAKGDSLSLHPSLHFGKIKYNRSILDLHANNPISQSVFSHLPQQFETVLSKIAICGSLADCKKQAVLYLEFEQKEFSALEDKKFIIFNAIASTLVDVMGQRL